MFGFVDLEAASEVAVAYRRREEMCERVGNHVDARKAKECADGVNYCIAYVRAKRTDWGPEVNNAIAGVMSASDPSDLEVVDIYRGTKRFSRCYRALFDLAGKVGKSAKRRG